MALAGVIPVPPPSRTHSRPNSSFRPLSGRVGTEHSRSRVQTLPEEARDRDVEDCGANHNPNPNPHPHLRRETMKLKLTRHRSHPKQAETEPEPEAKPVYNSQATEDTLSGAFLVY